MENTQKIENSHPHIYSGFSDSVHDSQQMFRKLLTAMSEPGLVQTMNDAELSEIDSQASKGLLKTSYALALTLFDNTSAVGLSAAVDNQDFRNSLSFHCACRLSNLEAEQKLEFSHFDFVIANGNEWNQIVDLKTISIGDLSYPEKSTTILLQVEEISSEQISDSMKLQLEGPGIQYSRKLFVSGIDESLIESINNNQRLFPLGLDFIFCAKDKFFAIPRSTFFKPESTNIEQHIANEVDPCM